MGTANRKPHSALIARLLKEPAAFDFFQAVHLLELELAADPRRRPAKPVGYDYQPSEVGLRFRVEPSLSFSPHPLAAVRAGDPKESDEPAYELLVRFLGLVGPAGTLPRHYTETVMQRLHVKEAALRDFLDMLQHRGVSLFYRSWKKHRLAGAYAAADRARGVVDPITTAVLALVGVTQPPRGRKLGPERIAEAHFAGLLANRRRSEEGLRTLLRGLLHCEIRVEQFVGEWVPLDAAACSRLGDGPGPGLLARLGDETVLGARVWSIDARVRVTAGPMNRERFSQLWPGSERLKLLRKLIRAYLGPLIECDLVWELTADAPAPVQLGADQRLGRDCWLGWSEVGHADRTVASPPWHDSAQAEILADAPGAPEHLETQLATS